jgi:signal transduction histidine kinase
MQYLMARSRWLGLAALASLAVIGLLAAPADHGEAVIVAGTVVTIVAGLLLVRAPRRLVLPCAALVAAGIAMVGTGDASNVGWFAVCVVGGWCVLAGLRRDGLVFWAGSLLLFGGEWLWAKHDPGWAAWAAGVSLTAVMAALIRHELDLVDQLRAAQAGLAERSRAEERSRIAREVHDVIAHSLTVSLLHLQSARLAVEYEPAEAALALAEAERLCRESLAEVRSTVGLLRQDPAARDHPEPPVPGIDGIAELAGRFRLAGADVSLRAAGDTGRLPATTGSAIYRILQEALTNTAKHAPGAPVEIRLDVTPRQVILQVDSAGPPGHGTGMGLLSMHERAEALGGRCAAGPGGNGWLVCAELPLDASLRPGI